MEQAPRVRGYSSLGCQKRGSPGRLTANSSLLATPSARLTVVKHTPSCKHRSLHNPTHGPFFVKVASEHPLPPSPPTPSPSSRALTRDILPSGRLDGKSASGGTLVVEAAAKVGKSAHFLAALTKNPLQKAFWMSRRHYAEGKQYAPQMVPVIDLRAIFGDAADGIFGLRDPKGKVITVDYKNRKLTQSDKVGNILLPSSI